MLVINYCSPVFLYHVSPPSKKGSGQSACLWMLHYTSSNDKRIKERKMMMMMKWICFNITVGYGLQGGVWPWKLLVSLVTYAAKWASKVCSQRLYQPSMKIIWRKGACAWINNTCKWTIHFGGETCVSSHVVVKWFRPAKLPNYAFIHNEDEPPIDSLQSKKLIPQDMHLGAIAKPIPQRNFGGVTGLYLVAMK